MIYFWWDTGRSSYCVGDLGQQDEETISCFKICLTYLILFLLSRDTIKLVRHSILQAYPVQGVQAPKTTCSHGAGIFLLRLLWREFASWLLLSRI